MFSDYALKLYAMKKLGIIKSNANFWRGFYNKNIIDTFDLDLEVYQQELKQNNIGLVCVFDKEFPKIDFKLRDSENPFLFVYKGNIELLNKTRNNIAVVGATTPTKDIINREENIVKQLVQEGANIVSGLAKGVDTVAHKTCIDNKGKTIAILPTTLNNIYPKENEQLVADIISNNGLVITEYVEEPKNRYDSIKRFIARDRLQAMLSYAVVLIASYAYGQGDSGSRHAMQKAKEYNKDRFVMYSETDINKAMFELNKQEFDNGAKVVSSKTIKEIV